MKYFGKRFLSGIFALMMTLGLLCTTASAAVQSSAYLDGYRVVITPDPRGAMVISVDVTVLDICRNSARKQSTFMNPRTE